MKFDLTERGGNLFDLDGSMIAWLDSGEPGIPIPRKRWVEVSYNENYPTLQIRTVDMTEDELAARINERLGYYNCCMCNIKGVNLTADGRVCDSTVRRSGAAVRRPLGSRKGRRQ